MIKAVIIGYGNIGKAVFDSLSSSKDFEVAGVASFPDTPRDAVELKGIEVVEKISDLKSKADVAIVCVPSKDMPNVVKECLKKGMNTVDAFDVHSDIVNTRRDLDAAAKAAGKASVLAAGWDPGSDSIVRALMKACAPKGISYTNFGPGMSMGHSVAARAVKGVKNALSMTIPLGTSIHRRVVYVEIEKGADFEEVSKNIKKDKYFSHDETHVIQCDNVHDRVDMGHAVNMVRKGVSGKAHNQLFEFNMKINNPALTGQLLVAVARAAVKQKPGCYTMIELPVIDMLPGDKEENIAKLV